MTVLFIWLGKTHPLYEWRTMCIRRAKEVYPDAKFKVITHLKAFFNMDIIEPGLVHKGNQENYTGWSDYARMEYLSKHKDTLYLDTDTWCDKPYPFTDKMASNKFEAIWSGKECDKIREVYSTHGERQLLFPLGRELDKRGDSLVDYCTHKPLWAKQYRQVA